MSTKFILALCISLICIIFTGTTLAQEFPPDLQRIMDKKELVVAMVASDQPPFFSTGKDGKLHGFDVEIAKDIAKELGVEVRFNRMAKTFNGTVDLVVNKEADIAISKLSKTLTRAKRVLFTNPYIVLRKGLLINRLRMAQVIKGREPMEFIKNLEGEIGVIKGSSYVGFAKQMFSKATVKEYKTWQDIIAAVVRGEVLAAFRDELEIKKVVRGKPDGILQLQTVVFKDEKDPIAMAVSSDSPHLLFWLNQYLDNRNLEMNADKLLDQYQDVMTVSGN